MASLTSELTERRLGLFVGVPAGLVFGAATLTGEPTGTIGVVLAWVIVLLPLAVTVLLARRAQMRLARPLVSCVTGFVVASFVPVIPVAVGLFT